MIYIDSGENKTTSKLPQYLPQEKQGLYKFLASNIIEQTTGADLIISPEGLPDPTTIPLINLHISKGTLLVQLKFGGDLAESMIDGRLAEAQSRMKETGATPLQRILLFIGVAHKGDYDQLLINNQSIYGSRNLKFEHFITQKLLWSARGGVFHEINSGKYLWDWLMASELLLKKLSQLDQKVIYPFAPALYEKEAHLDKQEAIVRELTERQQLIRIKDMRILLATLPGIGETRCDAIWDYLQDKSIYGLINALETGALTDVEGIGQATIKKIKLFLGMEKRSHD